MAITALALQHFGDPDLDRAGPARPARFADAMWSARLERFLGYYRNPTSALSRGISLCAAERAFPCGRTGNFRSWACRRGSPASGAPPTGDACDSVGEFQRKEVVIENDIAWRMDTLVDFVAGRLPGITSTAADQARARLTPVIAAILDAVGRLRWRRMRELLQELTLQG